MSKNELVNSEKNSFFTWSEEFINYRIRVDEIYTRLTGLTFKREEGRPRAKCCFHDDNNPSMLLNDINHSQYPNSLHCFVCNEHYGIIELLKRIGNCGNDYEARLWLENEYGLPNKNCNSINANNKSTVSSRNIESRIRDEIRPFGEVQEVYAYKNADGKIIDYNVRYIPKQRKTKSFMAFYYNSENDKIFNSQNPIRETDGGACYRLEKLKIISSAMYKAFKNKEVIVQQSKIQEKNTPKDVVKNVVKDTVKDSNESKQTLLKKNKNIQVFKRKIVLIVEGEKDVHTIENIINKYKSKIKKKLNLNDDELPVAISLNRCMKNEDGWNEIDSIKKDNRLILELLHYSEIYFISDTGEAGMNYIKSVFETIKNYEEDLENSKKIKAFYHCAFTIKAYNEMRDNQDITDYLELSESRKDREPRELQILNMLLKPTSMFDWKQSQNFVAFREDKPMSTSRNVISFMVFNKYSKIVDLSNKKETYMSQGVKLSCNEDAFISDIEGDLAHYGLSITENKIQRAINHPMCTSQTHSFIEMCKKYKNPMFEQYFEMFFKRFKFKVDEESTVKPSKEDLLNRFKVHKGLMMLMTLANNGYDGNPIVPQEIAWIIKGKQGCGKTALIKDLMFEGVIEDSEISGGWYNQGGDVDKNSHTGFRDSLEIVFNGVISELPENIKETNQKSYNTLKKLLSMVKTNFRGAYCKKAVQEAIRSFVVLTTNEEYFYTDPTGNRRFFVLDILDFKPLRDVSITLDKKDKESIVFGQYKFPLKEFWGSVYQYWCDNGRYSTSMLSDEEKELISDNNKKYMILGEIETALNEMFDYEHPDRNNYLLKSDIKNSLLIYTSDTKEKDGPRIIEEFLNSRKIFYKQQRRAKGSPTSCYACPRFSTIFLEKKCQYLKNKYENTAEIQIEIKKRTEEDKKS